MKLTIGFTAYRRPYYLEESLASWKQVRGVENIDKFLRLDPSDMLDQQHDIIAKSGLEIEVYDNPHRFGVMENPYQVLKLGFDRYCSDFVILAEEDLVVSTDVLEYFQYCAEEYSPEEVLGICAFFPNEEGDPTATFKQENFGVWIWGTWSENWYNIIEPGWDHNYSTNNGIAGQQAGWDWELSRTTMRLHRPFVHGAVSRSQHIGQFEGQHMIASDFESHKSLGFTHNRPVTEYRRV